MSNSRCCARNFSIDLRKLCKPALWSSLIASTGAASPYGGTGISGGDGFRWHHNFNTRAPRSSKGGGWGSRRTTATALATTGKWMRPLPVGSIIGAAWRTACGEISFSSNEPKRIKPRRNSSISSTPLGPLFSAAKRSEKRPIEFRMAASTPYKTRIAMTCSVDISSGGVSIQEWSMGGEASGRAPCRSNNGSRHLPSYTPCSKRACSNTPSALRLSKW
mmetsp:Transcript_41101/g.118225  ORF Transcript_41101/g.118225 Transcript_41101/m.118225 type:complete len:219 (+) Transcript_41101:73-729(+)